MILAGTLTDLDWLSSLLGPSSYLRWNGGALHSFVGAAVLALAVSLAIRAYARSRGVVLSGAWWWVAPIWAAFLHVGMDALLSKGVKLFWPFSSTPVALDWAPNFDLWILVFLTAGI